MPESSPWLLFSAESIVDSVREPLLVLDSDFRVMRANRSFHRAFRVSPEETENRLVYDLGNRQWDIPQLRHLLEEVLPHNTSFDDFEVDHDFPAIGRRFLLLNARRMHREGKLTPFILLAFEDVTEQRGAEKQRQELETRFTSLVKNIRDHSIFTTDIAGQITSWNVEAERILGHSEAEILGKNFSIIFTPEDVQSGMPDLERRIATEKGRSEDERWHLRKNGERFWALGIVTPTRDASGRHTGFSKILRDMTDRKRAEEALQRAHEAAETQVRERTAELRRANEELQRENEDRKVAERRLYAQHATTKALAESLNLEAALSQIIEVVCKCIGWAWAAVWMVGSPGKRLGLAQFWHSPSANLEEFLGVCREKTFEVGQGLLGRVWARGELMWAPDVMRDEDFDRKHAAAQVGLHAACAFPILLGPQGIGVIEFFSQGAEQPDDKILAMMAAICRQI